MTLSLPGTNQSSGSYLKTLDIDFKSADGKFVYYDGASIEEEKVEGIVIGEGFEFRGTVGRPTKNKAINYVSDTFGYDQMKDGVIRIHQFIRENGNSSNATMGKKTYAEWREAGMKLHRVVFLMQGETLAKVIFSPVATKPIGDVINKNRDLPNYVSEITLAKDAKGDSMVYTNDNGEFFIPTINKLRPIESSQENAIMERIKEVDRVVNKKEAIAITSPQEPVKVTPSKPKKEPEITIDEIPF